MFSFHLDGLRNGRKRKDVQSMQHSTVFGLPAGVSLGFGTSIKTPVLSQDESASESGVSL